MKKLVTEFIGTFFLIFTVGLVVIQNVPAAPIAIGVILMVMVYMGGHISGGHYNPAITLAMNLRGRITTGDAVAYMISQLLGALAGAGTVQLVLGKSFALAPGEGYGVWAALAIEFLFTFALVLVALNTATRNAVAGQAAYGMAIGLTVTAAAFAGGAISGAALNPVVGIGPAVIDAMSGGNGLVPLWIYLVGPLAGGIIAALVFGIQGEE